MRYSFGLIILIIIHIKFHLKLDLISLFYGSGVIHNVCISFLILSQLSYAVFFQRKIVKELAKIYIIVSLLFLLWIPSFSHQLQVGRDLRLQLPGWDQVVSPPQWKSLLLVMAKFIGGIKEINITPFDVAYYGIPSTLTMFLYLRAVKKAKHGHRMLILTPLVWLVISVCSAWLFSFIIPVLQPKRVLFALPAMYLMIGVGLRYLSIQKRCYYSLFHCVSTF